MAFESHKILSRLRRLSEAAVSAPFGTTVGWKTPGGEVYGVVVGKEGKELLCLTTYDKTMQKDKSIRFYRDEAASDKLPPVTSTVRMSLQRVPAAKAFKHGRLKGSALKPYQQAMKALQTEADEGRRGRSRDMDFTTVNAKLEGIRQSLPKGKALMEDAVESAFKQELRPWAVSEFEAFLKGLDRKVLDLRKGKWPRPAMQHGITRYRPGSMTHEDFIEDLLDHYLGWRNNMKHAAKTEGTESNGDPLTETTSASMGQSLNHLFHAKDTLDMIKGLFYNRLHGRGSVKDDTRTDSGPFFTPAERSKVAAVEKKLVAFETEIQDLLDKGRVLRNEIKKIDKLMAFN